MLKRLSDELIKTGIAFREAGLENKALASFRKSAAIAPDYLDAHLYLADALHRKGDISEAVEIYERLIPGNPDSLPLHHNLGVSLLAAGRSEEAETHFRKAIFLAPHFTDSRVSLSTALMNQGRYDEALAICEAVIEDEPENAEAHWNRALLLLQRGSFEEGFGEYEWRWRKRGFTSPVRSFDKPRWSGEDIKEGSVLVYAEQGFGDTIQFCRYIPLLRRVCGKVIFECHPELARLCGSLFEDIEVVPFNTPLPEFDFQIPLLSLPYCFTKGFDSIPADIPYLTAPDIGRFHFDSSEKGVKAGICWRGKSYPDPGRSCPFESLAPLFALEGVEWYSLDFGDSAIAISPVKDMSRFIGDFADTAEIISNLDLVVSIDSAVAHLAGALGKPVILMLPKYADWRWFLERDDSPWYPTMKIIRQKKRGEWVDVVSRCGKELIRML